MEFPGYFNVSFQLFQVTDWKRTGDPTLEILSPFDMDLSFIYDFDIFTYSPTSTFTGGIIDVGSGCADSDYKDFPVNGTNAALAERGPCTFIEKNDLAMKFGAKALLIYNNVPGVFRSRASTTSTIPVFGLSQSIGTLFQLANTITLKSFGENFISTTRNVLAETLNGNPDRKIVSGSHLDSVPAGPGINDNGSGSAGNLAMALHMARRNFRVRNRVIFAWWGAEELGLLGARHYVTNLVNNDQSEYLRIAANLNFDMIGSPNYHRAIYNASSGDVVREDIVQGSIIIQNQFEEYFKLRKLPTTLVEFNGRSDYGPFIENGICAGGLATGAEGIKTEAERILFGGVANAAYDPCYHQACDTIFNVNDDILTQNTNAAYHVLKQLATDTELVDRIYFSNNRTQAAPVTLFSDMIN